MIRRTHSWRSEMTNRSVVPSRRVIFSPFGITPSVMQVDALAMSARGMVTPPVWILKRCGWKIRLRSIFWQTGKK